MSLRVKLFASFFVFILVPLFVLGIAAYKFTTDMIEEKYSQQSELTLRAISQSVDFIFREMNKVTDSTIASRAIQEALKSGYGDIDITQINYLALNEVQRNFRELLVNHPSVSYAFMYTLTNERVNELFSKESFEAMPFEQFKEQTIYQKVLDRKGLPVWVGPYEYPELTGKEPVFTQIRVVKDINTLHDKGILLVQIKNSGLESVFRYFRYKKEQYDTQFLLVNDQGLILYDSDDRLHGTKMADATIVTFSEAASYNSERERFSDQDSIISSIGLGNPEHWQLISITSWDSLSSEINLYAKWVSAIIFFCLLSACAFILFFANRVARSIIMTVRVMRKVERGDLTARLPVSGNDETSLLARGFNSLVYRVAELLGEVKRQQERKTRAEMIALQAQIKPHFLFNALESINILAVQNQGKKVSQMVARLGNLLRISIQQQEEITIEQELTHLCSYLEIQKFRFEDLFDYEIDIPPELLACRMLKLTLQPLVENSIQHGFEGIEYKGVIRISARAEADRIAFVIVDNGIGMGNDRLTAFEYARELPAMHGESPETGERRGLGVCNVADRIRFQYGPLYGLFICSERDKGTIIRFVIPKYTGGDSHEIEGITH